MTHPTNKISLLSLLPLYPDAGSSAARQALQLLLLLRCFVTLISSIGLVLFLFFSTISVPLLLIGSLICAVLVSTIAGFWRLKQSWPVTNKELFFQLLLDVVFLVVLLIYTGGASNPLISYLLVLLAVAATLLSRSYVNSFALGGIVIYTFFLLLDLTADHDGNQEQMSFQLHLVGMWVIFLVSSILITVFISRMATEIRERELHLAQAREKELRNEQLVAIGTLAAGTAHALGTPLSTMSVLVTELDKKSEEELKNTNIKDDISLLRQQITRCKDSLRQLIRFYHKENENKKEATQLTEFVKDIEDYVVNIHPTASITFEIRGDGNPDISSDPSFKHAVINIIENGIKASRSKVAVLLKVVAVEPPQIEISITDDGPGIPLEILENMGEPFKPSRKDSMGLGIFLANAAIQRLGGTIEMFNLKSGGALTLIRLPLL